MVMVIETRECKENLSFFYDFSKIYQIIFVNKLMLLIVVLLHRKESFCLVRSVR